MSQLPSITGSSKSLVGWYATLKSGGPLLRVVQETPKLVLVKWWSTTSREQLSAILAKELLVFWTGSGPSQVRTGRD